MLRNLVIHARLTASLVASGRGCGQCLLRMPLHQAPQEGHARPAMAPDPLCAIGNRGASHRTIVDDITLTSCYTEIHR